MGRELSALRQTLRILKARILPLAESISERAVFLLEQYFLSHSLRLADALIAANALEREHTLVTGNCNHFRIIPSLVIERFSPN